MFGETLSVVIPLVIISYGVYLAVRMFRNRKKGGGCCGGCVNCPYAGSCSSTEDCRLTHEEKKHE